MQAQRSCFLSGRWFVRCLLAALLCNACLMARATDLADRPLTLPPDAKPNLLFILDNSGSMSWDYLPDSANSSASVQCYQYAGFNLMYYDPRQVYKPGMKADRTVYPDASLSSLPTNAYQNPSAREDFSNWIWLSDPASWSQTAYYTDASGGITPIPGCSASTNLRQVTLASLGGQQRVNFANWYAYHRTRMLAVQTAASRAFAGLDSRQRVGFSLINMPPANSASSGFVPVQDFTPCQAGVDCSARTRWYQELFGAVENSRTPLQQALMDGGQYFAVGRTVRGTRYASPLGYACQRNSMILATDGYWNETPNPMAIGNADKDVPARLPEGAVSPFFDPVAGANLVPGQRFPPPFREGPTASSGSLADIAMSYWISDLSASLPNTLSPIVGNPANWQHVVTHAIGLGIQGQIDYTPDNIASLRAGSLNWPVPVSGENSTVDDLWHATVNGHGKYFSVRSANEFGRAMAEIIDSSVGSASNVALAVNSQRISANLSAYVATYEVPSWKGDVTAYPFNQTTRDFDLERPAWSAATLLAARDFTTRRIASYSGAAGVRFSGGTDGLAAAQLARLATPGTSPDDALAVLAYLRGERTREFNPVTAQGVYRPRRGALGDIVDAAPVFVGPPDELYADEGYSNFRQSLISNARVDVVYAAANDGMLHAFAASDGTELWAYVPGLLIAEPLPSNSAASTLVNLASRDSFVHLQYANGTPVVGDVDLNNTPSDNVSPVTAAARVSPTPAWLTLLVAGLNKGGRGYYALDVTQPAVASEAEVARKVLWEFPNNATPDAQRRNMGYSYGKPVIVKTRASGWVVLVSSGYNNTTGDGKGHLFVLNARTGKVIRDLVTTAGSPTHPSGLAQLAAYVDRARFDNTTSMVYGGDLLGNVWRFDLSGASSDDWSVSLLATLTDGAAPALAQPITSTPELANVNGKVMVVVSTGRLLGESDLPLASTPPQRQTIYGLVDDPSSTRVLTRSDLVRRSSLGISGNGVSISATNANEAGATVAGGWLLDLARSNERSISDGVLVRGIYTQTTVLPQLAVPCTAGASSYAYDIDIRTGEARGVSFLGAFYASAPTLVQTSTGDIQGIIVTSTQGRVDTLVRPITPPGGSPPLRRLLWREIIN
jgi:type IV pilus assembly protein PilY1